MLGIQITGLVIPGNTTEHDLPFPKEDHHEIIQAVQTRLMRKKIAGVKPLKVPVPKASM